LDRTPPQQEYEEEESSGKNAFLPLNPQGGKPSLKATGHFDKER
jgi:hypothetical protein